MIDSKYMLQMFVDNFHQMLCVLWLESNVPTKAIKLRDFPGSCAATFQCWKNIPCLGVNDESDDEDDVDDGEGDEGVVEGGLHLRPHQDQDGSEIAQDANNANQGHQHLGE